VLEARTGQFLSACGKGELDRVKLMLGQGWDVNAADYGNRTGLMLAAANGQKVGVLAGQGGRGNKEGAAARRRRWPRLLAPCLPGRTDLQSLRVRPSNPFEPPPNLTLKPPPKPHQAVVDVLLAVNARPNAIDRNGSSALLEVRGAGLGGVSRAGACGSGEVLRRVGPR
jgi:ankyrin repeat protein